MKVTKVVVITIIAFGIGGLCAWWLRGEIDKYFMMEGHFHIISTASQNYDVVLSFPSGDKVGFKLRKGSQYDFELMDTGEGSIAVTLNGEDRGNVGYVTIMNSIVVLTIGDRKTGFSQIFPVLSAELVSARDADILRP